MLDVQALCAGPGCDRKPVAAGLCMRHYKRNRAGRPLEDPLVARLGTPDGFGRFGYLDGDDELLCHECGCWYAGLGAHANGAHGLTADQYRTAHGLARGTALAGAAMRAKLSANSVARLGSPAWKRLEQRRDPTMASHSREQPGVLMGAAAAASRATQSRVNGLAARTGRVWTCAVCGAQWSNLPGKRGNRCCGPACLSVDKAAQSKAAAAARYRELTAAGAATLLDLSGSPRLPATIVRVVACGVTQGQVASLLGLSESMVSRMLARWRADGEVMTPEVAGP
jgi:hypothetical protein